jgi:CRISPR system Cascade subunit CasC
MKHLELHILQSFPVACLNRDDLNSPKTAIFGGVQRARVSSQSWKRAIRELAQEEYKAYYGGQRTRLLASEIKRELLDMGCDENRAYALAMCLCHYLAKIDPKNIEKVKTMTFFSPKENKKLATVLFNLDADKCNSLVNAFSKVDIAALDKEVEGDDDEPNTETEIKESKKTKTGEANEKLSPKKFAKAVGSALKSPINAAFKGKDAIQVKDAADIALFGRMVANDHSLTLEGAAMFAHALSTHKVDNEIDFFSAVDDLQPDEESGAGMTGTLEFNSATYYRFAALNLDMLYNPIEEKEERKGHLRILTPDERREVVRAFIEATLKAVPGARKNSMNAATLPGYVLGVVRNSGHPVQLVNTFEKPIRSYGGKGLFELSLEAMKNERKNLNTAWGLDQKELFSGAIPDMSLENFLKGMCAHVE